MYRMVGVMALIKDFTKKYFVLPYLDFEKFYLLILEREERGEREKEREKLIYYSTY